MPLGPDIVVIHQGLLTLDEIGKRLQTGGFLLMRPDEPGVVASDSPRVLLLDALSANGHRVGRAPVVLVAPEGYQPPDWDIHSPDAIVYEPLRGREFENALQLTLHRSTCGIEAALVGSVRRYALFILNPEGAIVSWNPGGETVFGYSAAEILGKPFSALYSEQDNTVHVPEIELRAAASEGVVEDARWLIRRDGTPFWAETVTTAIKSRAGKVIGYSKIVRDATERRNLEQQLERSNDELQRFAYTVSHDLQEPLRTVRSYAELLTRRYKGKMDSDADEFIEFMTDAAGRMSLLLKDLLAYSQAGRPDRTKLEPTAAANVLQWAIMNVDRQAKESGASITYDHLPMVNADPTQLAQVFQNLLGNAIKYRGAEYPRIHVSVNRRDNDYEFAIRDNGSGIEKQHHERIFGVFKRLHGKEVPGTGIGLAICRKIIESHGGRIWVESEPGNGSTFKFTLTAHD